MICCLCGAYIRGFGNNPDPLAMEGRCCDDCNIKVIEARMRRATGRTATPQHESR